MAIFENGKALRTIDGFSIKLIKYLASGRQGDVYLVEYKGEKKVLKWYRNLGNDLDTFYLNLKRIASNPAPDKAFLWPQAVTEKYDGAFGYIMDSIPDGYYEFTTFMTSRIKFSSFSAMIEACIKIVYAMRNFHNCGYLFPNLCEGTFLINPQNGDTLIIDCDNVVTTGTTAKVYGRRKFMAPEIICQQAIPNIMTDLFSLSVILFLIIFMNHPFEGKKSLIPCITPKIEQTLYGSKALFIFDPRDNSNAPVEGIHVNALVRWGYMPSYIKEAFTRAFSQNAIKDPDSRLQESEWLKLLFRFKNEIVKCSCGNEVFIQNAQTTQCDQCSKPIVINDVVRFPDYSMPVTRGSRIYRGHLSFENHEDPLDPIALVVTKNNDPSILGLKILKNQIIDATTPSGVKRKVKPQEVIPFKNGILIEILGSQIKMETSNNCTEDTPTHMDTSTRPILPIIFVIDISDSMAGERIEWLNEGMKELIGMIKDSDLTELHYDIHLNILSYSTTSEWMYKNFRSMKSFEWKKLQAGGLTNLGAALDLLINYLETGSIKNNSLEYRFAAPPNIVYITDGEPTDDWERTFKRTRENRLYSRARKLAFAIGNDVNMDCLYKLVGNKEAICKVTDGSELIKFARHIFSGPTEGKTQGDILDVVD